MSGVFTLIGIVTVSAVALAVTAFVAVLIWEVGCTVYQAMRLRGISRRYGRKGGYSPVAWAKLIWWLLTTSGRVSVHGVHVPLNPFAPIRPERR